MHISNKYNIKSIKQLTLCPFGSAESHIFDVSVAPQRSHFYCYHRVPDSDLPPHVLTRVCGCQNQKLNGYVVLRFTAVNFQFSAFSNYFHEIIFCVLLALRCEF